MLTARNFLCVTLIACRPVYGHAEQGASFGHTKVAAKQVLRKGLSQLVNATSTDGSRTPTSRQRAERAGELACR